MNHDTMGNRCQVVGCFGIPTGIVCVTLPSSTFIQKDSIIETPLSYFLQFPIMDLRQRGAKILSVFFYGYGSGFAGILGFSATQDPIHLTIDNLLIYPIISGLILVFPQLGKTFGEIANARKN